MNFSEKNYLKTNTKNYISYFIERGIEMEYQINNPYENDQFEIEFKMAYKVYSTNFIALYQKCLKNITDLIESTYVPFYMDLRKDFAQPDNSD